jgi:predicted RNase H-like nuclease
MDPVDQTEGTVVLGADVWKGGWVGVRTVDGSVDRVVASEELAELVAGHPDAAVVGVDIPIGLLDAGRRCDELARARVGPRRASVFPAPPRAALQAADYAEARRLCRECFGRGLSAQSFALRHRILEADALARRDPRLHEVHPEVSFRALAGSPLAWAKRSWNGQMERRRLLSEAAIEIADRLEEAAAVVPPDDVLDAAVVAWTAARIAAGKAESLPDPPQPDDDGYPTAIWY